MSDLHQIQDERDQDIERGRKLAAAIFSQLERFYLAPGNLEEGRKLDGLQAAFLEWERDVQIQWPDMNTLEEFSDTRLRPPPRKMDQRSYLFLRRQWTVDELRAIPSELERAQREKASNHSDSGMWSGTIGI